MLHRHEEVNLMKDVNKVILVGRLGADPIQRETKAGLAVVHFPVATSRKLQVSNEGASNEESAPSEETQWHKVVTWGKQGENCAQYLRKGSAVYIEGMIRSHKYEGKDGTSRMAFEVHADDVNFLGSPRAKASDSSHSEAIAL
jgi:single-strand DNA-binding protein